MATTTKTTLYLDSDDYQKLRRMARDRGTSAAELVREAVAEYTARGAKPPRPRSIGMGRSGRSNLGSQSEKLLRGFGSEK